MWYRTFGPAYALNLRCRQGRLGDVRHLDEVFIRICGERCYLWRGGLARPRPGRPGDAPSGRESRQALLMQALEGAGWIAMAAGHGPTGKLCGRPQRPRADGSLSNRTAREQPDRGVPPAQPGAGTPHAPLQACRGRRSDFWRSMRPSSTHSESRVIASRPAGASGAPRVSTTARTSERLARCWQARASPQPRSPGESGSAGTRCAAGSSGARPTPSPGRSRGACVKLSDACAAFLEDARSRNLRSSTLGNYRGVLGQLRDFAEEHGMGEVSEIDTAAPRA